MAEVICWGRQLEFGAVVSEALGEEKLVCKPTLSLIKTTSRRVSWGFDFVAGLVELISESEQSVFGPREVLRVLGTGQKPHFFTHLPW